MLTFLFWNIHRKPLTQTICRLVKRHEVDFLLLAESDILAGDLLRQLNPEKESSFHYWNNASCRTIQIFARFAPRFSNVVEEDDRTIIRKVSLTERTDFLLAVTHLPSKLYNNEIDQVFIATDLARMIRDAEEKAGLKRTVLTGDLNMNPFDPGIVAQRGLRAVMTKKIALRGKRTTKKNNYPYFYNPMWTQFGDLADTPGGSYYYDKTKEICYFWNLFDQVMIRPELLPYWKAEGLEILTGDGMETFITPKTGRLRQDISDHLPIRFRLEL